MKTSVKSSLGSSIRRLLQSGGRKRGGRTKPSKPQPPAQPPQPMQPMQPEQPQQPDQPAQPSIPMIRPKGMY